MNKPANILYVHGYLGSGNGHSSEMLRGEFKARGIHANIEAPQFPVTEPEVMHKMLYTLIENNHYDYVVASSLGAFYVMQIPEIKKILINPAIPDNLRIIKESDSDSNPMLTSSFLDHIETEKEFFFSDKFNVSFMQETYLIYGTRDNIAPNEKLFKQYYDDESMISHVDMEHKLNRKGAAVVVELICKGNYQEEKDFLFRKETSSINWHTNW
ncbi:YqiA/YcfP family alpha/beta fold hydrolase [Butyrivibrio sp. LC3010]|uniref:YqiA/YcfP family alpha/beta fold hydrolase n=1 Tax=Butyrivibrio sp. LC3010 TaxID=1280680 RepID=UPI0004158426|nr:YqiA/YcfP family alpha/beta fold hydrolase [Butyrivibrio sp. LC3010]